MTDMERGTSAQHMEAGLEMLQSFLKPWEEAVADPVAAQQGVLRRLLQGYAQTKYGARHGAARVSTIEEYRKTFPIATSRP